MPPPIRDLFFGTELIEAMSSTPVNLIPDVDWDAKIRQTQNILQTYKDWLRLPQSRVSGFAQV